MAPQAEALGRIVSTPKALVLIYLSGFLPCDFNIRITCCSPAHGLPQQISSSGNLLAPNVMDSGSPTPASSPKATDNAEVLSRRTLPGQGEVREAVEVVPEGDTSAAGNMGAPTPTETGDGGHAQFGSQPDIIPETHTAPKSGKQPHSKKGGHQPHRRPLSIPRRQIL